LLGKYVNHLPANHSFAARGRRKLQSKATPRLCVWVRQWLGDQLESVGQKRIAGKYRGCIVKRFVNGRSPAAYVTIIHCRQIVVYQAIAMDHFDGAADTQGTLTRRVKHVRSSHCQKRSQPLSAIKRAVAHGADDATERAGARRQQSIKLGLNEVRYFFD
jgi:hypothetical protein